MSTLSGARGLYGAQYQFTQAFKAEYAALVERLYGIVVYSGGPLDRIAPEYATQLVGRLGDHVFRFFVGMDGRSAYAGDGMTPITPFARLLNRGIAFSVYKAVEPHATYLQRVLPQDIQDWLKIGLLKRAQRVQTKTEQLAITNPLAQYQAPHFWIDASGYRLSDRIWRTGLSTRLKMDQMLMDNIRSGTGARELARMLEQFLLPERINLRTKKPYGQDASYDAMRLARSEIGRAHSQATRAASKANPFVTTLDWRLSAAHPKQDVCDDLATIGMGGERIRDPYPVDEAPIPVEDSHAQCLCATVPGPLKPMDEVVGDLRGMLDRGESAPVTPIDAFDFITLLLGGVVVGAIAKEVLG